jgi:hypothetical protein
VRPPSLPPSLRPYAPGAMRLEVPEGILDIVRLPAGAGTPPPALLTAAALKTSRKGLIKRVVAESPGAVEVLYEFLMVE